MRVAVAVIINDRGEVLITQRASTTSHGGLWEFPGGKLESEESAIDALFREIQEEVGLIIKSPIYLGTINYQYSEKSVELMVFIVSDFKGTASCLEAQSDLRWVAINQLQYYEFPAANLRILAMIESYMAIRTTELPAKAGVQQAP